MVVVVAVAVVDADVVDADVVDADVVVCAASARTSNDIVYNVAPSIRNTYLSVTLQQAPAITLRSVSSYSYTIMHRLPSASDKIRSDGHTHKCD